MAQEDRSFWEYKNIEHQRLNTVIYGSGFAAVLAISHIGKNENTALFISAFIWALISYSYWFFAEGHIKDDADDDIREMTYKKMNLNSKAKQLMDSKLHLMNRCKIWNLGTLIFSWVLNILGTSLYFFHNSEPPHYVGWILIYTSILGIFVLVLWEYIAAEKWDKNYIIYFYSVHTSNQINHSQNMK